MVAEKTVKALGDGNCAFNAFILGLFALARDGSLESNDYIHTRQKLASLYKKVFPKKKETWENFKIYLNNKRNKKELIEMQKSFSIKLRELSAALIEKHHYQQHLVQTTDLLLAAFGKFLENEDDEDDIFIAHPFIKEKFLALEHKKNKLGLLVRWWEEEGYHKFLGKMATGGQWAGDLELCPLAEYFGINLNIYRHNKIISQFYNHGALKEGKIDQETIKHLQGFIIEGGGQNNTRRLFFRDILKYELECYLQEFIDQKKLTELEKNIILKSWYKNHKALLTISLINDDANHWDCQSDSDWLQPLHTKSSKKQQFNSTDSSEETDSDAGVFTSNEDTTSKDNDDSPSKDPSSEDSNGSSDKDPYSEDSDDSSDKDTFSQDGDDSSDEETITRSYAHYNLMQKYSAFQNSENKYSTDKKGYSFYSFAKGLELLYSPEVNKYYYLKKLALGRHKIYCSKKDLNSWVVKSIKKALKNVLKLPTNNESSGNLYNAFIQAEETPKLLEDCVSEILKNKRVLFKQRHYPKISAGELELSFKPLLNSALKFVRKRKTFFSDALTIPFTVENFLGNEAIVNGIMDKTKKYLINSELVDSEGKLLSKQSRIERISFLKAGKPNPFQRKLLDDLKIPNRRAIDPFLEKKEIICRYARWYIEAKIKKELKSDDPIIEKIEGQDSYFFLNNYYTNDSYLEFLWNMDPTGFADKYLPPSVKEIKIELQNQIKNNFFSQFLKYLEANKEVFNIHIERPVLLDHHCFHSNSLAEFLANLRLSYREQIRRIRQIEDDEDVLKGLKYGGEKFQRAWRFGKAEKEALETQEITTNLAKRDQVINLKQYQAIYQDISSLQSSINQDLDNDKNNITGKDIARWIKNIIQHTGSSKLTCANGTEVYLTPRQKKFLEAKLVNITYLIFGCEAIRNPGSLVSQVIMLERIIRGKLTWKKALNKEIKTAKGTSAKHTKQITYGGGEMPMSMGSYKDDSGKKQQAETVAAARALQQNYSIWGIKKYYYPGKALDTVKSKEKIQALARREAKMVENGFSAMKVSKACGNSISELDKKIDSWYNLRGAPKK